MAEIVTRISALMNISEALSWTLAGKTAGIEALLVITRYL